MVSDYAHWPEMVDIVAALVVLAAGVLRGLTGFGFALVAAIGLGQIWPAGDVAPPVLLCEIILGVMLMGDNVLPHAEPRRVVPLALGGFVGCIIGAFAFKALPTSWMTPALDAAVLISALVAMIHVRATGLDRAWIGGVVGALVGILVTAFAVGGPFAVVWLLAIGGAPGAIRANLVLFFIVLDLAAVVMRYIAVGFPPETLLRAGWLLPVALAGAYLGGRLFVRVDALWWRRIATWSIALGAAISLGRRLLLS